MRKHLKWHRETNITQNSTQERRTNLGAGGGAAEPPVASRTRESGVSWVDLESPIVESPVVTVLERFELIFIIVIHSRVEKLLG